MACFLILVGYKIISPKFVFTSLKFFKFLLVVPFRREATNRFKLLSKKVTGDEMVRTADQKFHGSL